VVVFIALSFTLNYIVYSDKEWNFYLIFVYFGDLTVTGVNSLVVHDYNPVVIKFSLFLVILIIYIYVSLFYLSLRSGSFRPKLSHMYCSSLMSFVCVCFPHYTQTLGVCISHVSYFLVI